MRIGRAAALVLVLVLLLAAPRLDAQVFIHEDVDFSNSAFVAIDEDTKADVFGADQKASEGEWAAALDKYQRVLDRAAASDATTLIEFTPRLWLSGPQAVRRRIAALPDAARQRYRELFEPPARAARERARSGFDARQSLRVGRRFPFAESGVHALEDAVVFADESGDLLALQAAVAELRALGALRASDVLRLGRALAARGDAIALADLVARSQDFAPAEVPLAGAPVVVGGELARRLEEIAPAAAAQSLANAPLAVDLIGGMPDVESFREDDTLQDFDPRRLDPDVPWPIAGAVRTRDSIVVAGRLGLYRFDPQKTAKGPSPPWRPYEALLGDDPWAGEVTSRALSPASDGRLLYVAINRDPNARSGSPQEQTVLFGFDPERDAKAEFRWTGEMAGGAADAYVLEGPPRIAGDLIVFAASRLQATTECALIAFERGSGRVAWLRFLASGAAIDPYELRNQTTETRRVLPSPLAIAGSIAYVCTNVGVVAAVDLVSGSVEWAFKYHRLASSDEDKFKEEGLYDTGGWERRSPIPFGDRLIVAPEDSRFLYVLARTPSPAGDVVLNDPVFKGEARAVLALDARRELLVLYARQTVAPRRDATYLAAIDLDGARRWSTPPFASAEFLAGRPWSEERIAGTPLIVGDALLLPTTSRLLRIALDREGLIRDQLEVPAAVPSSRRGRFFGNLERDGDGVLSVSTGFVARVRAAQ